MGAGKVTTLQASTTVSTAGGAVEVGWSGIEDSSGYLVLSVTNEVATASLATTVEAAPFGSGGAAEFAVHTLAAITAESTVVVLFGSGATAAEGITEVSPFPFPSFGTITLTVSGAGASFDVAVCYVSAGD